MKYFTIAVVLMAMFASANGFGMKMEKSTTDEWTKYPASYPYENDNYLPEFPPGHDNDLDPVTNPDLGGFNAKTAYYCNPFAYSPYGSPANKGFCGHWMWHAMYKIFEMDLENLSPFNCSSRAYVFEPPLKGKFEGGAQVCEPDKCCAKFVGVTFPSRDWPSLQEKWDVRYTKYYCTWYSEEMYCSMLFWQGQWCASHWISALSRSAVNPCYNGYMIFFERCQTFKAVGCLAIISAVFMEPDAYLAEATPQVINGVGSIFITQDKVCNPASNYDPTLSIKSEDTAPVDGTTAEAGQGAAAPPAGEPASAPAATPAAGTPAAAGSSASFNAPAKMFVAMATVFSFARFL